MRSKLGTFTVFETQDEHQNQRGKLLGTVDANQLLDRAGLILYFNFTLVPGVDLHKYRETGCFIQFHYFIFS